MKIVFERFGCDIRVFGGCTSVVGRVDLAGDKVFGRGVGRDSKRVRGWAERAAKWYGIVVAFFAFVFCVVFCVF